MLCLKTQVYDLKDNDLPSSPSIEISTMIPSFTDSEYFETCIFHNNGSKVVETYDSPEVALSGHRKWLGEVVENFYAWPYERSSLI